MRAEIISVGTELLLGEIVDTNAAYLSSLLPELGIDMHYRVTVGDNTYRLADALRQALSRSDIVFAIGGLGPHRTTSPRKPWPRSSTTRCSFMRDSAERLRAFFAARGIQMPSSNLKQAMAPTVAQYSKIPSGQPPEQRSRQPMAKSSWSFRGRPESSYRWSTNASCPTSGKSLERIRLLFAQECSK